MKTLPLLFGVIGFLAVAITSLAALLSPDRTADLQATLQAMCSPAQQVNVRLDSAECVSGGSAPVDCVDRARLEFCK